MSNYNVLVIDDDGDNLSSMAEALNKIHFSNVFPLEKDVLDFSMKITEFAKEKKYDEMYYFIVNEIETKNISAIFLDLNHNSGDTDHDRPPNSSGEKLVLNLLKNERYGDLPVFIYTRYEKDHFNLDSTVRAHVTAEGLINMGKCSYEDANEIIKYFKKNKFSKVCVDDKVNKYLKRKNYSDIAIVCALREEYRYIKMLSSEWQKEKINNINYDWIILKVDDKLIKIVARCIADMGLVESSTASIRIIDSFKPRYIAMTGICAGIKKEGVELGDILIPKTVRNWQSGKFKLVEGKSKFDSLPKEIPMETDLSEAVEELINSKFANQLIEKYSEEIDKTSNKNRNPNIFTEIMVSGSAVVADKKIITEVIEGRKVVGIDMEAYGVYYAAKLSGVSEAIVIKAVCDYADDNKDDNYHEFCAYSSAKVLEKLITTYIDW